MRVSIVLGILLIAPLAQAATQGSRTLIRGQRLRVTVPTLGAYDREARYAGSSGDTLMLTMDRAFAVSLTDVTRLEILAGQRSYKWPGAAIGLVCGALVGVGIGYAVTSEPDGANWDFSRALVTTVGGVGLGLLGLGVGALIGQSISTDRWEEVPLDRVRVGFAALTGGAGVGIRIAF